MPRALEAQQSWVVAGRVVDSESGDGIRNASVLLDGHGAVLTGGQGAFRFDGVEAGSYLLRVEALGYDRYATTVEVSGDVRMVAPLRVRPIELDEIEVELGTIDFDGEVRDPATGAWVPRAEVLTDQGHAETTSLSGRFDLDDVFDGPPLHVSITAFRFLPLDTVIVPDDEQRHTFDMAPDPVMSRMIDDYVARLDERAGTYAYEHRPPLDRDGLVRLSPRTSLQRALERHYPRHVVRRIGCLFLDEMEYRFSSQEERVSVMEGTVTGELERIELLEFPGYGRLIMARVYTRRYFQRHVGTDGELDVPMMVSTPGGTLCR